MFYGSWRHLESLSGGFLVRICLLGCLLLVKSLVKSLVRYLDQFGPNNVWSSGDWPRAWNHLEHWKKKSIPSCISHVTRCSLELQVATGSKQFMQPLQKVEPSFVLCNRCRPKKVAREVAKRVVTSCNLSRNAIAAQVIKKIAPSNTSCRARFYLLQRNTIASCSPKRQRVIFRFSCNLQWITFSNVAGQVAKKIASCNTRRVNLL